MTKKRVKAEKTLVEWLAIARKIAPDAEGYILPFATGGIPFYIQNEKREQPAADADLHKSAQDLRRAAGIGGMEIRIEVDGTRLARETDKALRRLVRPGWPFPRKEKGSAFSTVSSAMHSPAAPGRWAEFFKESKLFSGCAGTPYIHRSSGCKIAEGEEGGIVIDLEESINRAARSAMRDVLRAGLDALLWDRIEESNDE